MNEEKQLKHELDCLIREMSGQCTCGLEFRIQLAAVTKERDDWKLLSDCHTSSAQDLIAENASLREAARIVLSSCLYHPEIHPSLRSALVKLEAALKDRP